MSRFNPSKHPRGKGGKFRSNGGGISDRGNPARFKPKSSIPSSRRIEVHQRSIGRTAQKKLSKKNAGTSAAAIGAGAVAGFAVAGIGGAATGGLFAAAFASSKNAQRTRKVYAGGKHTVKYLDAKDLEASRRKYTRL
jgi:hypothetical protein